MMSTFVWIEIGLSGLICLLTSIAFAYSMNYDKHYIQNGTFVFNGMLVGMGIGFFFHLTPFSVLLLVVGGVFSVLLTVTFKNILEYYLNLPFLSIPFIFVIVILYLGAYYYGAPELGTHWEVIDIDFGFPIIVETYFRCLGAIFFQLNVLSGIIISFAMLIYSRIMFFLSILSYAVGIFCYGLLTDDFTQAVSSLVGFNFIITGIILGGILLIPSLASYSNAITGVIFATFLGKALEQLLNPYDMPVLAIPTNITVLVFIYALKFRTKDTYPYMVDFQPGTPEENLNYSIYKIRRFGRGKVFRFYLPFKGEWTVTQGVDGKYTHKNLQKYAWDFEVLDSEGKKYKAEGHKLDDYYAYNLPVYAPGDGMVVEITDDVEDNDVGEINILQNWGNYVILSHTNNCFSTIAHLKEGSIKVKHGDIIKKGTLIGHCGNSGRSPYPHIHFQAQSMKNLDSPTLNIEFVSLFKRVEISDKEFIAVYSPDENDQITSLTEDNEISKFFNFPMDKEYKFRYKIGNEVREEKWKVEADFYGSQFIRSNNTNAKAFFNKYDESFELTDYFGSKDTALFLFYISLSRAPFTRDDKVFWIDYLPTRYFLGRVRGIIHDLILPFTSSIKVKTRSRYIRNLSSMSTHFSQPKNIKIETNIELINRRNRVINSWKSICEIDKHEGLISVSITDKLSNEYWIKKIMDEK